MRVCKFWMSIEEVVWRLLTFKLWSGGRIWELFVFWFWNIGKTWEFVFSFWKGYSVWYGVLAWWRFEAVRSMVEAFWVGLGWVIQVMLWVWSQRRKMEWKSSIAWSVDIDPHNWIILIFMELNPQLSNLLHQLCN